MKFARVAGMVVVLGWFVACAKQSPEASAPSAGSSNADSVASPVVASEAPAAEASVAPAAPEPASPTPQGLDDRREDKPKAVALDESFKTLQEAERALDQAKADLDRLALAQPAPAVGRSAAAGGAAEKKDTKGAPSPATASAPNALCENACRAFSSLSRAASAVCRLDSSSSNSHCTRARRVVADSQQRVASCSCPSKD